MIPVLLFMGILVAASLVIRSMKYKRKQKGNIRLLHKFRRLAETYKITITAQALLDGTILGLDGLERKLLIVQQRDGSTVVSKLIDLDDVNEFVLTKQFNASGRWVKSPVASEKYLEKLYLNIFLRNGHRERICFYNYSTTPVMDLTRMANKARHWEVMLTKLLVQKREVA